MRDTPFVGATVIASFFYSYQRGYDKKKHRQNIKYTSDRIVLTNSTWNKGIDNLAVSSAMKEITPTEDARMPSVFDTALSLSYLAGDAFLSVSTKAQCLEIYRAERGSEQFRRERSNKSKVKEIEGERERGKVEGERTGRSHPTGCVYVLSALCVAPELWENFHRAQSRVLALIRESCTRVASFINTSSRRTRKLRLESTAFRMLIN